MTITHPLTNKLPLSRAILYYFEPKIPTFSLLLYKILSKMLTLTLLSILFSFRTNSCFPTVCNSILKYQRRNFRLRFNSKFQFNSFSSTMMVLFLGVTTYWISCFSSIPEVSTPLPLPNHLLSSSIARTDLGGLEASSSWTTVSRLSRRLSHIKVSR